MSSLLRVEALVLWGAHDRFVPLEQAERQRESFPSAQVVVLEDSGHYAGHRLGLGRHQSAPSRDGIAALWCPVCTAASRRESDPPDAHGRRSPADA